MTITASVAEAKAHLSEYIGRAVDGHERVVITKRGKPIAAIVAIEDMPAEEEEPKQDPLFAIMGLCAEDTEFCDILDEIYASRQQDRPRPVPDCGWGTGEVE